MARQTTDPICVLIANRENKTLNGQIKDALSRFDLHQLGNIELISNGESNPFLQLATTNIHLQFK